MVRKHLAVLGSTLILLALVAAPAFAGTQSGPQLDIKAQVTCDKYTLLINAWDLTPGQTYLIKYKITLTPTVGGTPINIENYGQLPAFVAAKDGRFFTTITEPLGPLAADYTLTGAATITDETCGCTVTVPIAIATISVNCAPPPPPACSQTSTNDSNFNAGTGLPAGSYVWFNANFTASGIPSTGATITFTNSVISSGAYNLAVPNGVITFSPTAKVSSTIFDSLTNAWETTVPVTGENEIFLSGLAWPVPVGGLPAGVYPVAWTGTFGVSTDIPGITIQWKWNAEALGPFTTNYNLLGIKAGQLTASPTNGNPVGTPEGTDSSGKPYCGGGGTNPPGASSGPVTVTPVCSGSGPGGPPA